MKKISDSKGRKQFNMIGNEKKEEKYNNLLYYMNRTMTCDIAELSQICM